MYVEALRRPKAFLEYKRRGEMSKLPGIADERPLDLNDEHFAAISVALLDRAAPRDVDWFTKMEADTSPATYYLCHFSLEEFVRFRDDLVTHGLLPHILEYQFRDIIRLMRLWLNNTHMSGDVRIVIWQEEEEAPDNAWLKKL
jgi:hypothetical protein